MTTIVAILSSATFSKIFVIGLPLLFLNYCGDCFYDDMLLYFSTNTQVGENSQDVRSKFHFIFVHTLSSGNFSDLRETGCLHSNVASLISKENTRL